jgi:hypothetical protein
VAEIRLILVVDERDQGIPLYHPHSTQKRRQAVIFNFRGEGPEYPNLGTSVEKFRRLASRGVSRMAIKDRRDYGAAVERAILAKQREERFHGYGAINRDPANSRSEPIGEARVARMRANLISHPSCVRRARHPAVWQEMYETAMREKSERTNRPACQRAKALETA